jgi:hypothetical protein
VLLAFNIIFGYAGIGRHGDAYVPQMSYCINIVMGVQDGVIMLHASHTIWNIQEKQNG